MVRFDVSTLIKARFGAALSLNVDTGPQDLSDLEVDFLRGVLRAIRVQGGVLVQGTVQSQLRLQCVRCLEDFDLPIALELEETFRLPGATPTAETPYVLSAAGWMDLVPLLREQCWLSIPMKALCSPNCKGLCPQCGTNLNLSSCACHQPRGDPRLAVLKDLL